MHCDSFADKPARPVDSKVVRTVTCKINPEEEKSDLAKAVEMQAQETINLNKDAVLV